MCPQSAPRWAFTQRAFTRHAFTLVEIMIVVLIIGILLAIAVPNFVNARETSRAKSCVGNLFQINSAKTQCMMDYKLSSGAAATFSLDGVTATTSGASGTYQLICNNSGVGYLRLIPSCPSGGTYAPGSVGTAPTCSVVAASSGDANYQSGGKWYHGY